MVAAGGILASVVALLLVPDESSSPVMERTVVFASILSGGMFGLFCLGFFTRRATRTGCYVGIGACLLYTAWGVMTQKSMRECVDLGPFNFEMNPILIGIGGHLVLFIVGYLASLVLGGYRPDNIDQLVVLGQKKHGVTTTS
jgi:SSS family solute:Na+ symporter